MASGTVTLFYALLVLALSLGAAVSLGITRFAYALLLPVMRADLGWSYTLAGAMNTVNALGYLLGALAAPALLRRLAPGTLLLWGAVLATLFMALSGFFIEAVPLLLQRLLAGVASAVIFIAGGLMAARLGALDVGRSGLLLGLYYGGVGWGISASALLVPPVLAVAPALHGWTWAWWALAAVCALATAVLVWPVRALRGLTAPATAPAPAKGLSVGASGAEGAKAVAQHATPPAAASSPASARVTTSRTSLLKLACAATRSMAARALARYGSARRAQASMARARRAATCGLSASSSSTRSAQ